MNIKNTTSELLFGLTIFVRLIPLAFMFSQKGTQLLIETSFRYFVWCGEAIVLFLLALTKQNLSKKQMIALATLCLLVPFTFTFNENGVTFLILDKYISSILSWLMASVLFSKLISNSNIIEKSSR